jgi:UDP-N-acetylglucosamine acyltransferase
MIHPLAVVSPRSEIGRNVSIGPFSVIEDDVRIGDDCTLSARVSVKQGTRLGAGNEISEGAVLGGRPQHKRAGDRLGELHIGSGNSIREYVTIHRGLEPGHDTTIADGNLFMVNSHIAHDCRIGSNTIMVNNVMLAGHVTVGNCAYLAGAVGVHQFCRIGPYAMVGGQAHINQDVPPYVTVDGETSLIVGLNAIGLRRAGFSRADIQQLKDAYRIIYRSGMKWADTLRALEETFRSGPATHFIEFFSTGTRGFTQERRMPRGATIAIARPEPSGEEPNPGSARSVRYAG